MMYSLAEDLINFLDRIKIRSYISCDVNFLGSNLGKRDIRDRHCLRLHLKLEILKLGNHIIVHFLIPLINRFTEDSSDNLERINIRSQVGQDENMMGSNL